jgi:hypothetical protein
LISLHLPPISSNPSLHSQPKSPSEFTHWELGPSLLMQIFGPSRAHSFMSKQGHDPEPSSSVASSQDFSKPWSQLHLKDPGILLHVSCSSQGL